MLASSSAALAPTGTFGFVFTGIAVVAATWLLVHSLFTHVDGLVKTRLGESERTTNGRDAESNGTPD